MGYRLSQFYVDRYAYCGHLSFSYIDNAVFIYNMPISRDRARYQTLSERTGNLTKDWHKRTSKENIASLRNARSYLDWTQLTMHMSLHIRDILEASDMPWNFLALHGRSDFVCELVKEFPHVGWNWTALFHVWQDTIIALIKEHPDAPWNWEAMARVCSWSTKDKLQALIDVMPGHAFRNAHCASISWEVISQNIEKPWDFQAMSRHAPWWIIARHPSCPWCRQTVTTRWDLPRAMLVAAPHLIQWRRVWRRPWVTDSFVRKHWKLPWRGPSKNKKRDQAARIIQQAWRLNIWFNPHTGPGRRRLLREFNELCESDALVAEKCEEVIV